MCYICKQLSSSQIALCSMQTQAFYLQPFKAGFYSCSFGGCMVVQCSLLYSADFCTFTGCCMRGA